MTDASSGHRWVLAAIAGLSLAWLVASRASDFQIYYGAGRALIDGGWGAVYQVGGYTPFKYHPAFAIAFAPFALLPFPLAKLLWALLNTAALYDALRRWLRSWHLDSAAIAFGFLAIAYALTWQYKFANVTFIMLWLWTLALTTISEWPSALAYALLIALKPFWAALFAPWIFRRRFSLIGRVIAMLAGISLFPLLLGPSALSLSYQRWYATFLDPLHPHNYPKADNQSWFGLLYRHVDTLPASIAVLWLVGSAMLGLLWLWSWRRALPRGRAAPPEWQVELSFMPVILFAAPLSWIHHQILLWPLLAAMWQAGRTDRVSRWVYVVAFLLLTAVGQGLVARPQMAAALRWGAPLLAMPLLVWWGGREWGRGEVTRP